MSATVSLRAGTVADHAHVVTSFIVEYRRSPHGSAMTERLAASCIEALIKSPAWVLTVMAPSDGGDEILGWALWQNKAVAWVSVKEMYRGHGLCRVLLGAAGCYGGDVFTPFIPHRTSLAANFCLLAESKGFRIRHRPHLLLKEILNETR